MVPSMIYRGENVVKLFGLMETSEVTEKVDEELKLLSLPTE